MNRAARGFFKRSQGYWIQSMKTLSPAQTHSVFIYIFSLHVVFENGDMINNLDLYQDL